MRRESGSAAAVIVIVILLLAAGAYYFFYHKDKPAEPATDQPAQGEATTADDPGEPKAHERIRDNYKEKLNKRVENIPE